LLQDAGDLRTVLEDFRKRPADVARTRGKAEHPVGDIVHRRNPAVSRDGEHTRTQVEHQVTEEAVGQRILG